MTQKIVIKVHMSSDRCRSKAMALVVATSGVDSVALAGDPKDQVGDTKKEEEKKKPAQAAAATTAVECPWHYYQYYPSHAVPVYEHPAGAFGYQQYHSRPDTCSIM
ncbi:hypothetical protein ACQ4PT_041863 [Festuca glaucescens]